LFKKFFIILGLVVFFAIDDVFLLILFLKMGFPHLPVAIWVLIAVFLILLNVSLAMVSYRTILKRPTTGKEGLVAATGVVVASQGRRGKVMVRGEHWDAEFTEDLSPGDEIRVSAVKGLTLVVESDTGQGLAGKHA
jgi:membrane-bound serine protease (ClpP class)